MRKFAPALIVTALFALASGSAMALGDRAKEKKANTDAAATSQSSATPKSQSTTPPGYSSSTAGTGNAAVNGSSSKLSQADPRCDESKYTSRSAMPRDCIEKSGSNSSPSGAASADSGASSPSSPSSSSSSTK